MPTYEAICDGCGNRFDFISTISAYNCPPECPYCESGLTRRIFTVAPSGFVKGKFEAFRSKIDGSLVRNSRELEEHNKRNDVVLLGEGYDSETIVKGNFNNKREEMKKEDRVKDIEESIHMLNQGYKPELKPDTPVEEL